MTEVEGLTLDYRQARSLLRHIENLHDGFNDPTPPEMGTDLTAPFRRGAHAALNIMNDIVRCASLVPVAVDQTESRNVLTNGGKNREIERCAAVK